MWKNLLKLFLKAIPDNSGKKRLGFHFIGSPRPSVAVRASEAHPFSGTLAMDTTKEERDNISKKTLWFDDNNIASVEDWNAYCEACKDNNGTPVLYVDEVTGKLYTHSEALALKASETASDTLSLIHI